MKQQTSIMRPKHYAYLLLFVAALLALSGLHSCRSFTKIADKHPAELAKRCATDFPVKESTRTITKYLPGKRVQVASDPVFIEYDCDSAIAAERLKPTSAKNAQVQTIRIPVPTYIEVDTQAIQSEIVWENVAALAALTYTNDSLNTLLIKSGEMLATKDKKISTWRQYAINAWVVCLIIFAAIVTEWLMKSWLSRNKL